MKRNLKYKRVIRQGQTYIDIHKDFTMSLKNDISVVSDAKQIEQSISGIILTRKGESPLDPEFGSDITESLFENMDDGTAYMISQQILQAIEKYEPRVQDVEVNSSVIYEQNQILVTIKYFIKSVNEEQILEYELSSK